MRSVALAAVVLGVLVQVPLLVAQTGKESQPLVPVTDLAPQDGAVSAPVPTPAPAPAPQPAAPSEPASPEPPAVVPSDQMAAGTAPALEPTEDLAPVSDAELPGEPLGEPAQAGPGEPPPEEPGEDEPEQDETDPEEFEREFEDVPEEDMPPLTRRPVPTAAATAGGLPQTGSDIVILELMGGLLMGVGLALRLALSID